MGGYRQDEVDVFLDKVEADYEQNERTIRALQDEIEKLGAEIEDYKNSQESIQTVLLNAQKLADQMIAEAKEKSAVIIADAQKSVDDFAAKEKELSVAFEAKAGQRKAALERDIDETVREAEKKNKALKAAAEDAVARQQVLFDKLKLEISAFKADITRRYKEHLEILQKIPDEVPMDPVRITEIVSAAIDQVPNPQNFIPKEEEIVSVTEQPTSEEAEGFKVEADTAE